MSISVSLQKAIKLQEKIDEMREQLAELLNKARQELASAPAPAASPAPVRRGKQGRAQRARTLKRVAAARPELAAESAPARANTGRNRSGAHKPARQNARDKSQGRRSLAGQKRAASPSGPLAPAVVKVLKESGEPMRVADILKRLLDSGYEFNSPEPRKNLAARIYRLRGVRQVEPGLFGVA